MDVGYPIYIHHSPWQCIFLDLTSLSWSGLTYNSVLLSYMLDQISNSVQSWTADNRRSVRLLPGPVHEIRLNCNNKIFDLVFFWKATVYCKQPCIVAVTLLALFHAASHAASMWSAIFCRPQLNALREILRKAKIVLQEVHVTMHCHVFRILVVLQYLEFENQAWSIILLTMYIIYSRGQVHRWCIVRHLTDHAPRYRSTRLLVQLECNWDRGINLLLSVPK